jgi:thiol-disulfide isomerase/thioredoxin
MMKKVMLKTLCILTLALFIMSTAGAATTTATTGKIVVVTQLSQINTALHKGPVFLRLGASWCPHCKAFEPTLEALAKEYAGKATFMSIDITKSPKLASYFGVSLIPDCSVIVGTKNGKYVYMEQNGKTTTVRSQARIIRENHPKSLYETVLNFAIKYRKS